LDRDWQPEKGFRYLASSATIKDYVDRNLCSEFSGDEDCDDTDSTNDNHKHHNTKLCLDKITRATGRASAHE
jgi:hypothetical protein